jgi:hypothetical protein
MSQRQPVRGDVVALASATATYRDTEPLGCVISATPDHATVRLYAPLPVTRDGRPETITEKTYPLSDLRILPSAIRDRAGVARPAGMATYHAAHMGQPDDHAALLAATMADARARQLRLVTGKPADPPASDYRQRVRRPIPD